MVVSVDLGFMHYAFFRQRQILPCNIYIYCK